jgi:hypothetical protein
LISYLSERAKLTAASSGILTSGMFGGDLKISDSLYYDETNTARFRMSSNSSLRMQISLVDESGGIGPKEEDGQ